MRPLTRIAIALLFLILIAGTTVLVNLELRLSPDGIQPDNRTMIVYMTLHDNQNIDAVASASCTGDRPKPLGITEMTATAISEMTGGAVNNLVVKSYYSEDREMLNVETQAEKAQKALPDFRQNSKKISKYNRIFLGFPIWWDEIPRVVYSFLEQTDLSGKQIFIFTSSNSEVPDDIVEKIRAMEPEAKVDPTVLNISPTEALPGLIHGMVKNWLLDLSVN